MKKLVLIPALLLTACGITPQDKVARQQLFLECVRAGVNAPGPLRDNAEVVDKCNTAAHDLTQNF